jgi:hypothetical protein
MADLLEGVTMSGAAPAMLEQFLDSCGLRLRPGCFQLSDLRPRPPAMMRERRYAVRCHENIEGGHGAAADNEQFAFKWALVFEFLWEQLTK